MLQALPPKDAAALNAAFARQSPEAILAAACHTHFPGRIAVLSSFGADSVVLLHALSAVAPDTPVLFLQTGKHFLETLEFRAELAERLGLTNVVDLKPDSVRLREHDPNGTLHADDPEGCCAVRKVAPLASVVDLYDALVTGRRRHQTVTRARLPHAELDGPRMRINPLAGWDQPAVDAYVARHDLPRHPLTDAGYRSIGCAPCTTRTADWEDPREGRWRGLDKTECGIHRLAS